MHIFSDNLSRNSCISTAANSKITGATLFVSILNTCQSFFSLSAGCFGVGRRPTDLLPMAEVTKSEAARKGFGVT